MPRKKAKFSQADLTRVMKSLEAAKVRFHRVEVSPDGVISVFSGTDRFDKSEGASGVSPLEAWKIKQKEKAHAC